ncbi:hypothetical protein JYU34_006427 [Plutella xylostella]|uniref:Uncharacterized protein n=1 Tax=Plutella xylostella TaxID=51655 RepID=A0ABQ7QRZ8_PLUXY|nr:hypothetical protein JYU34_006427 [Plutella xylostella]
MDKIKGLIILIFYLFSLANCVYSPISDEVQAGSVLLPATRRGRYLANIIRRQAVDGTGIKFHKDADRLNAESKKKIDVLSEELLPYIIAEQERRTTLYKRVMTAIQNGEKGVTIAEIRNKPPVIIRKGSFYRCPSNRAPREPDGSGTVLCEDESAPLSVLFESCLSAEDKELYTVNNQYFFCNRHKQEPQDLPRNGSTVFGCQPAERTSLNYTKTKCALEDTDDVVVHYRYYPDKSYKFVQDLDPDREVCDHWNPCQIGYIFSIASADQALLASEIWKDSTEEGVHPGLKSYETSPRQVKIPEGYTYEAIHVRDTTGMTRKLNDKHVKASVVDPTNTKRSITDTLMSINLVFPKWMPQFYGDYFAVFRHKTNPRKEKRLLLLSLVKSSIWMPSQVLDSISQHANASSRVPFRCEGCRLLGVMVRATAGTFANLASSRYRVGDSGSDGQRTRYLEIDVNGPAEYGDYFAIVQNSDGLEERVKALSLEVISLKPIRKSAAAGSRVDEDLKYECEDCQVADITCRGASVTGRVSVVPEDKRINFNFPRYEDTNACVYIGYFKAGGQTYEKVLAIMENVKIESVVQQPAPKTGEPLKMETTYTCDGCEVEAVLCNGRPVVKESDRNPASGYYKVSEDKISLIIEEFASSMQGIYQAIFIVGTANVTKTIMEIEGKLPTPPPPSPSSSSNETDTPAVPTDPSKADNDTTTQTTTTKKDEESPVTVIKETRNVKKDSVVKEEIPFNCTDCEVEKVMFGNETLVSDTSKPEHYTVEDKIIKVSIEKFDTLNAGDYSATFKFKEREPHTEVILSLSLE